MPDVPVASSSDLPPALPPPLAGALARETASVGTARGRQLRWVAGEMAEAAGLLDRRKRPRTAAAWFAAPFVPAYLQLADAGELRRRASSARPGTSSSSARVRRVCLRILAGPHASALPPLPLPRVDPPHERALPPAVDVAVGRLVTRASAAAASSSVVRAAALTALIADTGMRVGETASVRVADVDLAGRTLRWVPRPQARRGDEPLPARTSTLRARTVAAVQRWLEVRAELTTLTPAVRELFVSVAGNHDGSGVRRPAGLPLRERGMQRAHSRAVAMLNAEVGGQRGYPLPRVLGALRHVPDPPDRQG